MLLKVALPVRFRSSLFPVSVAVPVLLVAMSFALLAVEESVLVASRLSAVVLLVV